MPGNQVVPETEQVETVITQLRAENERLHERVKQLEDERERDRLALASLQAERDAYRRAAYAWALEQITDKDIQQYGQNEEGLPLDDFIGELEQGAKVRQGA